MATFAPLKRKVVRQEPARRGATAAKLQLRRKEEREHDAAEPTEHGDESGELQRKIEIGEADNAFEREADQVAHRVMRMPASTAPSKTVAPSAKSEDEEGLQREEEETEEVAEETPEATVQRACASCGDDEEKMQRACATCEHEEEDQVQRVSEKRAERGMPEHGGWEGAWSAQTACATSRSTASWPNAARALIQRKAAEARERLSDDELERRLRLARADGGTELPRPVRAFMEPRFGKSFAHVRVHHDAAASELARSVHAKAFTLGHHVFFKQGEYRPASDQGRQLIAHELTHVVQQQGGLHSVQREVLQRDADTESATDHVTLDQLKKLFRWNSRTLTERVRSTLTDLAGRALRLPGGALDALAAPTGGRTRRLLRSALHQLEIEVSTSPSGALQRRWRLVDEKGKELAHDQFRAHGSTGSAATALDDQTLDLETQGQPSEDSRVAMERPAESAARRTRPLTDLELKHTNQTSAEVEIESKAAAHAAVRAVHKHEPMSMSGPREHPMDARASEAPEKPPTFGDVETEAARAGERAEREASASEPIVDETKAAATTDQVAAELAQTRPEAQGEAVPQAPAPREAMPEAKAGAAEAEAGATEKGTAEKTAAPAGAGVATEAAAEREPEIPSVDEKGEADDTEARMAAAVGAPAAVEEGAPPVEPVATPAVSPAATTEGAAAPLESALAEPPAPEESAETAAPPGAEALTPELPAPEQELSESAIDRQAAQLEQASAKNEAAAMSEAVPAAGPTQAQEGEQQLADEVGPEAATNELLPAERQAASEALADATVPGPAEPAGAAVGAAGAGPAEPAKLAPEPPDVSSLPPEQAVATVAALPPVALRKALGGVKASATHAAQAERTDLAANPPSLDRPLGAPANRDEVGTTPAPVAGPDPERVAETPAGPDVPVPAPAPVPEAPPPAIAGVPQPTLGQQEDGKVAADDAERMRAEIHQLPVTDPALRLTAGEAPRLVLEGNADPHRMVEQHGELRDKLTEARTKGAEEAAAPMGEERLFPQASPEKLVGAVPSGGGAPAGAGGAATAPAARVAATAGAGGDAARDQAISRIVQEEHGAEIQNAGTQAQSGVEDKNAELALKKSDAAADTAAKIADAEKENAAQQAAQRQETRGAVGDQRSAWTAEQRGVVSDADAKASGKVADISGEVAAKRTASEAEAAEHIATGNEKAEAERQKGEREAAEARQSAQEKSSGIFGWLKQEAQSFFNAVKRAITDALEAARKAVKSLIEAAKKLAVDAIEAGRKFVVDKIHAAGDFLIGLGDIALAAFPNLRDKFRGAIKGLVAVGERAVNKLADGLKAGVQALLDAWGKIVDAAIGLFEEGLLAIVSAYEAAVIGAIDAAESAVKLLGVFAAIIGDIASDPIGWIKKLAAAALDGIKNHLWATFKEAVKDWFNSKVEGVLSVGKAIWAIVTGKLGLAEIGHMAFEAIKALIPPTLVRILIEKLVALIVPAAGALLAIVEGLQAAWGTLSRILQALDAFVTFLKAVKAGTAGPLFAKLLASAAIVVLDFVANFLLAKLASGLKKFAAKIKGLAQWLMKKAKAALRKVRSKFGKGRVRGAPRPGAGRRHPKRRNRDQQKKHEDALQQVEGGIKAVDRALSRPMPARRARALVGSIARRFRVNHSISEGSSWTITFSKNPKRGTKAKRDAKNRRAAKLGQDAARLAAEEKRLADQGRRAAAQGLKFQLETAAIIERESVTRGGVFAGAAGPTGFDVASIFAKERFLEIGEIKRGQVRALTSKSRKKSREQFEPAQQVLLMPGQTASEAVRKDPKLARMLVEQNPERRKQLRSASGRDIENQVSAITSNLLNNLSSLASRLERMAEETESPAERAAIRRAGTVVRRILAGEGGRLRIVITTRPGKEPSPAEFATINALLDAVRVKLGGVQIEPIVIQLNKDGELIGGR